MNNKQLWMQDIEAMSIMNKKINSLYEIIKCQKAEIEQLKNKKSIFKRLLDKIIRK